MSFYDGGIKYGDDTPQKEQIVLKGQKAVQPENPDKTGYRFRQWVETDKGSIAFDFDKEIEQTSRAYADWFQIMYKFFQ